ncbi:MAG TPA: hypothetical protein VLI54_00485 [Bacillota bacterium]|nr:hypothetical protein [Bacillota bacterium]
MNTSPTIQEQFQDLFAKLKPILKLLLTRYMLLTLFLPFMVVYIFLVLRINQLSSAQPTVVEVDSKLQTIPQPKVDKNILAKIQQLQDQNIQVKALFDEARQNPFAE